MPVLPPLPPSMPATESKAALVGTMISSSSVLHTASLRRHHGRLDSLGCSRRNCEVSAHRRPKILEHSTWKMVKAFVDDNRSTRYAYEGRTSASAPSKQIVLTNKNATTTLECNNHFRIPARTQNILSLCQSSLSV
jgi:hypothetical protein